MEEIGDWIYILVLIIAGVASVFNSARKKAQQAADKVEPREIIIPKSEIEDVWDDYIPRAEPKPVVAIPPKPQSRKAILSETKQNKQYSHFNQEGQPALQIVESKPMSLDDDTASITIDDMPGNVDDWRKAFIYNEIFSRKN